MAERFDHVRSSALWSVARILLAAGMVLLSLLLACKVYSEGQWLLNISLSEKPATLSDGEGRLKEYSVRDSCTIWVTMSEVSIECTSPARTCTGTPKTAVGTAWDMLPPFHWCPIPGIEIRRSKELSNASFRSGDGNGSILGYVFVTSWPTVLYTVHVQIWHVFLWGVIVLAMSISALRGVRSLRRWRED